MDRDEEELIGEPIDNVPKKAPDYYCNARKVDKSGAESTFRGYCGARAGKGTDTVGEGRCNTHDAPGGAREGAGAPKGNTNAVSHGAYADENRFYQNELDDSLRALADSIHEDYMEQYTESYGKPPKGIEMELFRLAVSHVKDIVLDNWADDRPSKLETANAMVEKETEPKFIEGVGEVTHETYKESVVLQAQKKLSTDRRQWLKDLGLLEDPESQKAGALESWREWIDAGSQSSDRGA